MLERIESHKRELECTRTGMKVAAVSYVGWGYTVAGIEAYPTSHPSVKSFLEGAKSKLARPVRPGSHCPLKRRMQAIADHVSSNSLCDLCFFCCCCVLLVGFAEFFRRW